MPKVLPYVAAADSSPSSSMHPNNASGSLRRGRNHLEDFVLSINPNYQVPTDKELNMIFRATRAPKDQFPAFLEKRNRRINARMKELGSSLPLYGFKPKRGDEDVHLFHIPDSTLAICIWPGSMRPFGQYCLDFFDTVEEKPVNAPKGFKIHRIERPGTFSFGGPLVSWEKAMQCTDVPPGSEKYSVPEGSYWYLKRHEQEKFSFAIPLRAPPALQQFAVPVPYR